VALSRSNFSGSIFPLTVVGMKPGVRAELDVAGLLILKSERVVPTAAPFRITRAPAGEVTISREPPTNFDVE